MQIHFTKMQGCGNDYVYISGFSTHIPQEEKPDFVRAVSDRHFGIGGDGVIFINPSKKADFEMEMFNADGTRSEMCGNGIRCVAKYVYDKGLTDQTEIRVISGGSVKRLKLFVENGKVRQVRVNMGRPVLEPGQIPVEPGRILPEESQMQPQPGQILPESERPRTDTAGVSGDSIVDLPIIVNGKQRRMTCVSMGNPHAVVYVEDVEKLDMETEGPAFENHPCFPRRVNTEFVAITDRENVKMRVWERGTGETLACGTGCCAVAVAGVLNGVTGRAVHVHVPGGVLFIEWDEESGDVFMTGPAETVFEGYLEWGA